MYTYFYDRITFRLVASIMGSGTATDGTNQYDATNTPLPSDDIFNPDTQYVTYDASTENWIINERTDLLSNARSAANSEIDNASELKRLSFLTPGVGQSLIYQKKEKEAADYVAAGYPIDLSSYPFIQAESNATGNSPTVCADNIVAMSAQWILAGASIEEIRLTGKKAVSDASDVSAIEAAVQVATSTLKLV